MKSHKRFIRYRAHKFHYVCLPQTSCLFYSERKSILYGLQEISRIKVGLIIMAAKFDEVDPLFCMVYPL